MQRHYGKVPDHRIIAISRVVIAHREEMKHVGEFAAVFGSEFG